MAAYKPGDDGPFIVTVPRNVYRCSAIKNAAYKFTDRLFVSIDSTDPHSYSILLRPKVPNSCNATVITGEFLNELLDQDLRETIAEETNGIRDLILAQAFSKVSIFHPDFDKPLPENAEAASQTDDPT